jgi:hypothetical protein
VASSHGNRFESEVAGASNDSSKDPRGLRGFRDAFFCVGATSGAILGYCLYALVLHAMDTGTLVFGHDAVFWGSVLAPGLLCGVIGIKLKEGNILLRTTVVRWKLFRHYSVDRNETDRIQCLSY